MEVTQDQLKKLKKDYETEILNELIKYYVKKEWKNFINHTIGHYELMEIAFKYFDEIPEEYQYNFAVRSYIHHGDSIPGVRKALRKVHKIQKAELPEELERQNEIVVYRSGEEPINLCKYRISWTTDLEVAKYFYETYTHRHASYMYKALIKPNDIIAYCDTREEKEVMQYNKVYNVVDITP